MKAKLNKAVARKVLKVVDAGLCSGVGRPVPGEMCVEAAVCYALGEPHGDEPSCVGAAVRAFKIRVNDGPWSSNAARAAGMREIAIAQLGSDQINQQAFAEEVALQTIKQIVPIALRAVAALIPDHKDALEAAASACVAVKNLSTARAAAYAAAYAAARAAAANAANAAADAAYAAADADKILCLAAQIGLKALKKLKTQGCEWLDLTKEAA